MMVLSALVLGLTTARVHAFSLLGPYTDWMNVTNGYRMAGDIGGPVDITEGYRWNVPVVTYAFDQSFLDYFGSNGVADVESAIQMLNDLPAASDIVVTNYPTDARWENYRAASQNLYNLKSTTLAVLLEEMGLAQSQRYVLALHRWDATLLPADGGDQLDYSVWPPGTIPNFVYIRNFDPETLLPSPFVNGVFYLGWIQIYYSTYPNVAQAYVVTWPVDPSNLNQYTPVAECAGGWSSYLGVGSFFVDFTQDDVGGLRFLLSSNNVAPEILLPDIHAAGSNSSAFVNFALRPGVEKITFVRQDYDPLLGQAFPLKYEYTDTFLTNGVVSTQQLERVVSQPDFLFCSGDTGGGNAWTTDYLRTDTSKWWNSATLTGGTNAGPGIIRPPIRITFNRYGSSLWTSDPNPAANPGQQVLHWGSFSRSTNAPVVYPISAGPVVSPMAMRLRIGQLYQSSWSTPRQTFEWQLPSCATAALQTSSNLVEWVTCLVVTNQGAIVEWHHNGLSASQEFFRAVPQ
jgi:hypothetical protein